MIAQNGNFDKALGKAYYGRMKTPWYKKILEGHGREALHSAIVSVAITIAFSFWYFASGKSFEWHSISPIPQPGFFASEFYGAFAFVTIGAFLYYVVKLWKGIYFVCVEIFGSRKLYRDIKAVVWVVLVLITQFYIVPTVIDWANAILSFFYNMWFLFLYTFPPLGIFLAIFGATIFFLKRYRLAKSHA
jgi:hypothetical protein